MSMKSIREEKSGQLESEAAGHSVCSQEAESNDSYARLMFSFLYSLGSDLPSQCYHLQWISLPT